MDAMDSEQGNTALKVHKKRIHRQKHDRSKSESNQGHRVDKIIRSLTERYASIKPESITSFSDFPLSSQTQQGLEEAKFTTPTDIQRQSIGLALQGQDILGAAKTGSGKTLAFLIPVLELLYRNKVGYMDGICALIVSPTRELAYQTYSVLQKTGQKHDFSAGLVIGGKDLKEEKERISGTHVVICTPGRLQQHMEQTWGFNADSLQILVLDECDRILDMGFEETMNSIIEYIPADRQTLMFSATQTKSVRDLARVGLKSPHFISVHEKAEHSTPSTLEQSYLVCELTQKLNLLWFFIKNHLKCKILVFVQTSKQVRYIYESFERMRSGTTLLSLYGAMKQTKRVKTYESFCRKQNVVLLATDLAARGLDFPGVKWVVQFDAPDDADTYIHRVGRTARYDSDGEALLFLLPSEKAEMCKLLAARKIPIEEIDVNPKKVGDVKRKLSSQLVEDPQLKEFAKACFISYMKGYFLMKNKAMFDLSKLNADEYALSLGLIMTPRIRFLQKHEKLQKEIEKQNREIAKEKLKQEVKANSDTSGDSDEEASDGSQSGDEESDDQSEERIHFSANNSDEDDVDDLLTLKPAVTDEHYPDLTDPLTLEEELQRKAKLQNRAISKRDLALAMKKKGLGAKRTTFSDSGQSSGDEMEEEDKVLDIAAAKKRLEEADQVDKETDRARVKRKHQERRWKAKMARREDAQEEDGEMEAVLGSPTAIDGQISNEESDSDQSKSEEAAAYQSESEEAAAYQSESEEGAADQSESEEGAADQSDAESVGEPEEDNSDSNESADADESDTERSKPTLEDDEAFALKLLTSAL